MRIQPQIQARRADRNRPKSLTGTIGRTIASIRVEALTKGKQLASSSTQAATTSSRATTTVPQPGAAGRAKKLNVLQEWLAKYSAKKDIPTEDKFYAKMSEDPDIANKKQKLLFWSFGPPSNFMDPSYSSQKQALKWATTGNVVTLRKLLPDDFFKEIVNKFALVGSRPETPTQLEQIMWKRASRAFSRHAQGIVRVILTDDCTKGSRFPVIEDYWVKYEWPILIGNEGNNKDVTEIWRYEADDKYWDQAQGCYTKYAVIWKKEGGTIPRPQVVQR